MVKHLNSRRRTSWLFTSVAEDLNSGLLQNQSSYQHLGLGPEASKLQVQLSNHLAMLPPYASCIKVTQLKHLLFKKSTYLQIAQSQFNILLQPPYRIPLQHFVGLMSFYKPRSSKFPFFNTLLLHFFNLCYLVSYIFYLMPYW